MPTTASTDVKPIVAERKHLTPAEAGRLIAAAGKRGRHGDRDCVMLRMTYRHGMRASEVCGLRWSAIDLDAGTLHVARVKGSNASTHTMDRDELGDLRRLRKEATSPYVFMTERGGPLSIDALQRIVKAAGVAAKLDIEAHPHMLRHAAGYMLANQGIDTRLIQGFLGHVDIRHTVTYTALSPIRLAALRVR